jgi:hypothetical protein
MIAASRQLDPVNPEASAIGIYMSLRHAPLLKSTGDTYGRILCEIVIAKTREALGVRAKDFDPEPSVGEVQFALSKLAAQLKKRLVLYFDDAAHLGREASLEEFFDIYRTLSSSSVSCKAAIYPGVTRFGIRFDVYNDATVIDLLRSEELPDFATTFHEVMQARYPDVFRAELFSSSLDQKSIASFLAQAVLGNMRSFIIACNTLKERCADGRKIGLPELGETLIELARNYYWPLLDEIRPKLGVYEPMVATGHEIANIVFIECAQKSNSPRDIIIHRDLDEKFSKPLQILEYAGFLSKREASRGLKSGGRGARYASNLCSIFELTHRSRLTKVLFDLWMGPSREEAIQFSKGSKLADIALPETLPATDLAIFQQSIQVLRKSNPYPYGLSDQKIQLLLNAGFQTVGDLVDASDDQIDAIKGVGDATLLRIRNVLGQAIWM